MFGLSPHDIDREAKVIHVVRQVQQVNNAMMFCLPKREKVRDAPLSALLEGGVSIKAVSEYMGHADPGFTLRTYTHLMLASHDRSRRVIDSRIGRSDGLETACEPVNQENHSSEGVDQKR
jgi:hypothetical protein